MDIEEPQHLTGTPPKFAHQQHVLNLRHHLGQVLKRYELSDNQIHDIVMEVFPL